MQLFVVVYKMMDPKKIAVKIVRNDSGRLPVK